MNLARNKVLALAGAAVLAPVLLFAAAAAPTTHQGGFSQHMAQKLGLSDEQTQQVQTIFANHKAEMSASMAQMKTARTALFDAVHADNFDESAVRAAAANVATVEADLAVSHAKIASEVRNILTPDQQVKAKAMLATMRAHSQRAGGRGAHQKSSTLDGGV